MPKKFAPHQNADMAETNPTANPRPPHPEMAASPRGDLAYQVDQKQVVAGARALIAAMMSNTPKDRKFIERIAAPLQDDLARVDVLASEGRTADEAWVELDRIKKAAGIMRK